MGGRLWLITEGDDPAELGRPPEALERLAKRLEAFLAFDAEDASVRDRSRWKAALDGPLPQEGVGLDG